MGEATSKARPHNSLLEEDLEFERLMKAVPVITEETVQGLEERIKARIIEGRFDDVVRLRPVEDKPFLPSRFFELQDTKSSQSLAQIYEDEYTATQNGGVAGEDRDGKLKKEHEEIEKLWEGICSKLDALCNAHFTPKQVGHFTVFVLKTNPDMRILLPAESNHIYCGQRFCCNPGVCASYQQICIHYACSRRSLCTIIFRPSCSK